MTEELPDKLYFRIGEVSELVGVEPHVLRYWETEFRLRPHRSGSGQRLYRKQDVSRFFRVKALLHEEGYTIAGARKLLLDGESEAPAAPSAATDRGALEDALRRVRELRAEIGGVLSELRR
jgi:DNA-binding transcriptional MerR regulator